MNFANPTSKHHNEPTAETDPTREELSARGKIILVTGGGTTIGAATVEAFAKAEAKHVFLTGRRVQLLEDLKQKLSPKYPATKFYPIQSDVSKETDVAALFSEISKVGQLDVLVANAGYLPSPGPLKTSDKQDWWAGFEINVLGTYLLAKAFVNQPGPRTSTPVFIGLNTGVSHLGPAVGPMSAYGASKLAAASVVEFLQAENPEIKAFNISPGIVQSDMSDKANLAKAPPTDSPNLAAHLAVWLASPESDFLKGRFIWANWDVSDLVKSKNAIINNPTSLRITLDGWSDNFAALK